MDINLFVNALTLDEKKDIFNELKKRFEKGETLQEFYNRLLNYGPDMSVRMYTILTKTFKIYPNYCHLCVSEITDNLLKLRGFGSNLMEEFIKLRGY